MRCRYTEQYAFQAWIIALSSMMSCLIGFGEIAVGVWLILHNTMLIGVVGEKVIQIYYSYMAAGVLTSIIATFGFVVSLLRRRCMLLLYIFLMLVSIMSQCAVWIVIYIEQRKVTAELLGRLQSNSSSKYYEFIDHHYNCQLQNTSHVQQTFDRQLQMCADFLFRQTWTHVYAVLALCAALICLQCVIVLMAAILSKLLKNVDISVYPLFSEHSRRSEQRSVMTVEEDLDRDLEGSTVQLRPILPSAPPPPVSPSYTPTHMNFTVPPPPFQAHDGFALSYNNPGAEHGWAHYHRQPSITNL